jgi:hypothetical protein
MSREPTTMEDRIFQFSPVDIENSCTLSREQLQQFNQNGYLSGIDIFTPSEASELQRYIEQLVNQVVSAADQRNSYSINNYHVVCQRLYDLVVEPRILALIQDILGTELVCWSSHLFAKLAGDRKVVPLHQDAVYWPLTPSQSVTAWLAIDDVDAENSAMEFIPGSHLSGALAHETQPLDGTRVLARQVLNPDQYTDRFINVLSAGQLSLHSDLLLHGSAANGSSRNRCGLSLRYIPAGVRIMEGFDVWRKSAVHCLDGDAFDYWYNRTRPEGENPEKLADFWGEFDGQSLSPTSAGRFA